MPNILVVDDSAVDRNLVTGILKRGGEIEVDAAANGVEALQRMEAALPDLVVTDLRMPEMDGLELVANIRRRFPFVPVILMTSRGSEDIAVESLRKGASSYVPKRALSQDLLPTVYSVLDFTEPRRSRRRLLGTLVRSHTTYQLDNDYQLISSLVAHLEELVKQIGLCDETDCIRVSVALLEALANALYHGNLEVDSDLREKDFDAYHALARERTTEEPYASRRIAIDATIERHEGVFIINDEGPGFDPATLPDPTSPPNLERVSGRGVMLMRTMMDEVIFNAAGNQVTLIKRAESSDEPATS